MLFNVDNELTRPIVPSFQPRSRFRPLVLLRSAVSVLGLPVQVCILGWLRWAPVGCRLMLFNVDNELGLMKLTPTMMLLLFSTPHSPGSLHVHSIQLLQSSINSRCWTS